MDKTERLLNVLFGERAVKECDANKTIDELKKEGKRDNDIAERFLTIAENRVKRLAKLIEITAPPIIIDNEINLIRKAYYVLAVIGFKNTLEVEYFEKTLKDKE